MQIFAAFKQGIAKSCLHAINVAVLAFFTHSKHITDVAACLNHDILSVLSSILAYLIRF